MNLLSFLPAGLSIDDVIVPSAAVAALVALLSVWQGLVVRDPLGERLKALASRRDSLMAGKRRASHHRARGDLRGSSLTLMRRIVDKLNLMKGRQIERVSLKLARAGWRSKDALITYIFAKATLPFVCGGGALAFFGLSSAATTPASTRYLMLALGFVAGLYGADLFVKRAVDRRKIVLRKGVPDALDLLVICAEAGLSLDSSMTRVGRELAPAAPELADEIALTAVELGFYPDRHKALQNLVERTDLSELRSLVNSLMQTERYGTPLSQSLRVLASEFRDERLMRAEEKAARLPAIMTVPMIMFILPTLFIVIGGPAALRILDMMHKL